MKEFNIVEGTVRGAARGAVCDMAGGTIHDAAGATVSYTTFGYLLRSGFSGSLLPSEPVVSKQSIQVQVNLRIP